MSLFDKVDINFLILTFKIGCFQSLLISKRGKRTKFRVSILGCGKIRSPTVLLFLKSIISISHSRGEFFGKFFLPNFLSISLHLLINSEELKLVSISKTTFKNFGLFGLGHDKLS